MPSAVQKRSLGSVTVFSLNRGIIEKAIDRFVAELSKKGEVLKVVLFGSWARSEASVGSDVDFLVVLRESDMSFLDRIAHYTPNKFPIDADVFPYTLEELKSKNIPIAEQALKEGKVVFERDL